MREAAERAIFNDIARCRGPSSPELCIPTYHPLDPSPRRRAREQGSRQHNDDTTAAVYEAARALGDVVPAGLLVEDESQSGIASLSNTTVHILSRAEGTAILDGAATTEQYR